MGANEAITEALISITWEGLELILQKAMQNVIIRRIKHTFISISFKLNQALTPNRTAK